MKYVQIFSCVLACLSLAASVLCGIFLGLMWFLILVVLAAVFVMIMLFAKNKTQEPPPRGHGFLDGDETAEGGEKGAPPSDANSDDPGDGRPQ